MRLLLRLPLLLGLSLLLVSGEANSQAPGPVGKRPVGTKMTVFYSFGGQESEDTTYFRADARRWEFRDLTASKYGPRLVSIERCDLGQMFGLNLDLQQYQSNPYPPQSTKEQFVKPGHPLAHPLAHPQVAPPGPPTLHMEVTTVDTGERKDFFGHQARHVITTRIETPLDATKHYIQETVTDGWYIDIDTEISCQPWWSRKSQKRVSYLTAGEAATGRIEFVQKGNLETGFVTESKTVAKSTYISKDGATKVLTSKSREKD